MEKKEALGLCILFAVLALVALAGLFVPLAGYIMLTLGAVFCAGVAGMCFREYRIKKD